jgi:hypothetical protein
MGTQCTTGTHATFIPLEDHLDVERAVLDSQAVVLQCTMDVPRDQTDREDGSGLEFECQLPPYRWQDCINSRNLVVPRERDCFYYIIEQTYDVGLHYRRHPMEFDAGTRPFASFDAPSS